MNPFPAGDHPPAAGPRGGQDPPTKRFLHRGSPGIEYRRPANYRKALAVGCFPCKPNGLPHVSPIEAREVQPIRPKRVPCPGCLRRDKSTGLLVVPIRQDDAQQGFPKKGC